METFSQRNKKIYSVLVNAVIAVLKLYSLTETARANALEQYTYLLYLIAEMPNADILQANEWLLPEISARAKS